MNQDEFQISDEVISHWQTVIEEMNGLADELEEDGIDPVVLHPGDVSVVPESDEFGLHIVIPNNEFRTIQELIESGAAFDEFQVYKRSVGNHVYAVVVVTDSSSETAVLYPTYYTNEERGQLKAGAKTRGEMLTHLRTINQERLTLTHETEAFFS